MRRTNDETALHLAAAQGHIQVVRLLVTSGARINSRDADLATPLVVACKFNHYKIVDYLLQWYNSRDNKNALLQKLTTILVARKLKSKMLTDTQRFL